MKIVVLKFGGTSVGTIEKIKRVAEIISNYHKKKYKAQVMADGSIYCNKIQGSIHKVGAQVQGMPSCNGWSYWHFNIEGKLEPIDFLRRKVREAL